MKTKLVLDIHRVGYFLGELSTVIARHNQGDINIGLNDLVSFVKIRISLLGSVWKDEVCQFPENSSDTVIVSDKEGVYLTITEIELHELVEETN